MAIEPTTIPRDCAWGSLHGIPLVRRYADPSAQARRGLVQNPSRDRRAPPTRDIDGAHLARRLGGVDRGGAGVGGWVRRHSAPHPPREDKEELRERHSE